MAYTQVWDAMANAVSAQVILRDDGAFIPFDDANVDYCGYQAWLAEGNEPAPATPPAQLKE